MITHRRRRRLSATALALATLSAAACSPSLSGSPARGTTSGSAGSTVSSTSAGAGGITTPPSGLPLTSSDSPGISTRPTAGSSTATSSAGDGSGIGADGIGDPYYPTAGNGGYQVDGYDLAITYDPETNDFSGTATITGSVTEAVDLRRFNFDLQPTLEASAVTVNGEAATVEHDGAELMVTPASPLAPESKLTIVVEYGGSPELIEGGTANLGDGGWYRTQSGGALALGEPFSASAWYPANEHPSDPATFAVTVTVPDGWDVISNGIEQQSNGGAPAGMTTSRWVQAEEIPTYLTTLYIDKFTTTTGTTSAGIPIVNAFAPVSDVARYEALSKDTGAIIDLLTTYLGEYPFDSVGGIYTGEAIPFALETATRPVYANWVDEDTVVHELAHQWFGDDVFVKTWSDICLNECFASYLPWIWFADTENRDLDAVWKAQMATVARDSQFWSSPLVDMGAGNEFSAVYTRGPLALHALRAEMGDDKFFQMLKGWIADNRGRNATFDEWAAYTSQVAGTDLTDFIDAWFRGTTVPAQEFRYPGNLGG
ncbi:M1 family peptidase [Nakamurella sp. YIM 132087]|uniref:Aminopeptidase N n=1 Tax=Nakamurella alba TaxID=2665158 RepID=A0A7K1FHE2_9ACTN|nr:M1 family metallopeptidase [Nakamurella alba]MTD13541.1 M1 family peptidase [Nakamurella alba]